MKVILLKDVAKIGRRFEVKEVPGGHALNFLIPRKLAEAATPDALRRLQIETNKKSILSERHDTSFKSSLDALKETTVTLALPANAQGNLFKGVHARDVVEALKAQGVVVEESEVVVPHPIKEVGTHTITLKSGKTEGTITLTITKA